MIEAPPAQTNDLEKLKVNLPVDLEKRAGDLTRKADTMQVTDRTTFLLAKDYVLSVCRPLVKEIKDCFDGPCDAANKLHKSLTAKRKKYLEDPLRAEEILERKMSTWEREEEARLQAEARKLAEERERKEREERERREIEERGRLEAEQAAQAAAKKAQEDAIMKRAEEAEKRGDLAERDRILGITPAPVKTEVQQDPPPPPPAPSAPTPVIPSQEKDSDLARTKTWKWDLAIPGDTTQVKREYLMLNSVEIGKVVRALGPKAQEVVGGIRVYEDRGYQFRENGK